MSDSATFTGPALVWHRENGKLRLVILPERSSAVFDLAEAQEAIRAKAMFASEPIAVTYDSEFDLFTAQVEGSDMAWDIARKKLAEIAGVAL